LAEIGNDTLHFYILSVVRSCKSCYVSNGDIVRKSEILAQSVKA